MADSNTNPYLALLQQEQKPPGWAEILHIGNLGFGLAGGFGQAAATGQPTMAAIGPGLMMGNQMNAQTAHQAEQERMKRLEWQFKAQEHEDKRAEMLRKEKQLQLMAGLYGPNGAPPGFNATPQQGPLMGPTPQGPTTTQPGPDLKTGGAPLVDYLVAQHGLSPLAASTVVGNLYQESGFNPSATGDSGSAFGMAQWRLDRQTGLRNFAAAQNKPVTDPQVQLDYLVSEMKGGDMGAQRAWAGLQQAKTPEQANAAIMHFFRPAGYTPANPAGGHGFQNRVQNTQTLLPQGRPSDPTYAPVPTVDPYAVSGPPAGPAPRPGLGPRATPPAPGDPQAPVTPGGSPIDPNAQPPPFVAQGGGEGEVVLPRIGLPFPARPPAAAPPGSVPFPAVSVAPGGPVQPNYTPTPGTPSMAPGGAPASGGANPPPVFAPPRPVGLPPEFNAHVNRLVGAELITPAAGEKMKQDYSTELNKQVHEAARAQHTAAVEVWKQREQVAVEQRKIQAQVEAEQRAVAQKDKEHARSREEEGDWIRQNGVLTFVPKKDIKPGMMKEDTPKEPPAPGTTAGDDHILSTADRGSVEYRDAYDRQAREPKVINGQAYVRDMTKVPPPTYGQPAGAPAPSAAPPAAPASKPSDVPGMKPVGTPQLNNEQARDAGFADRMQNSNRLLSTFDTQGANAWQRLSEKVPGGAYAQSPEYQQFKQARDDFINAQLRRESGSAIGVEEYEKADRQYFPQPGDKPEVIKQKALNRQLALEGMVRGAGPSYQPSQSVSPALAAPPAELLQEAKNAIMKGAPRAAVIDELKAKGFSSGGL